MYVNTVIVEQLESDGHLKILELNANEPQGELLVISLAGEYNRERSGPFHFRDPNDEKKYLSLLNSGTYDRLGPSKFKEISQNEYQYSTSWYEVPTKRGALSYYALYLPEYTIPNMVSVKDPYDVHKQFNRTVFRDKKVNRYIIYLECRSKKGKFSFDLQCQFRSTTKKEFFEYLFKDKFSDSKDVNPKEYESAISDQQITVLENTFFVNKLVFNSTEVAKAAIVAPNGHFQEVNVTHFKDGTFRD